MAEVATLMESLSTLGQLIPSLGSSSRGNSVDHQEGARTAYAKAGAAEGRFGSAGDGAASLFDNVTTHLTTHPKLPMMAGPAMNTAVVTSLSTPTSPSDLPFKSLPDYVRAPLPPALHLSPPSVTTMTTHEPRSGTTHSSVAMPIVPVSQRSCPVITSSVDSKASVAFKASVASSVLEIANSGSIWCNEKILNGHSAAMLEEDFKRLAISEERKDAMASSSAVLYPSEREDALLKQLNEIQIYLSHRFCVWCTCVVVPLHMLIMMGKETRTRFDALGVNNPSSCDIWALLSSSYSDDERHSLGVEVSVASALQEADANMCRALHSWKCKAFEESNAMSYLCDTFMLCMEKLTLKCMSLKGMGKLIMLVTSLKEHLEMKQYLRPEYVTTLGSLRSSSDQKETNGGAMPCRRPYVPYAENGDPQLFVGMMVTTYKSVIESFAGDWLSRTKSNIRQCMEDKQRASRKSSGAVNSTNNVTIPKAASATVAPVRPISIVDASMSTMASSEGDTRSMTSTAALVPTNGSSGSSTSTSSTNASGNSAKRDAGSKGRDAGRGESQGKQTEGKKEDNEAVNLDPRRRKRKQPSDASDAVSSNESTKKKSVMDASTSSLSAVIATTPAKPAANVAVAVGKGWNTSAPKRYFSKRRSPSPRRASPPPRREEQPSSPPLPKRRSLSPRPRTAARSPLPPKSSSSERKRTQQGHRGREAERLTDERRSRDGRGADHSVNRDINRDINRNDRPHVIFSAPRRSPSPKTIAMEKRTKGVEKSKEKVRSPRLPRSPPPRMERRREREVAVPAVALTQPEPPPHPRLPKRKSVSSDRDRDDRGSDDDDVAANGSKRIRASQRRHDDTVRAADPDKNADDTSSAMRNIQRNADQEEIPPPLRLAASSSSVQEGDSQGDDGNTKDDFDTVEETLDDVLGHDQFGEPIAPRTRREQQEKDVPEVEAPAPLVEEEPRDEGGEASEEAEAASKTTRLASGSEEQDNNAPPRGLSAGREQDMVGLVGKSPDDDDDDRNGAISRSRSRHRSTSSNNSVQSKSKDRSQSRSRRTSRNKRRVTKTRDRGPRRRNKSRSESESANDSGSRSGSQSGSGAR